MDLNANHHPPVREGDDDESMALIRGDPKSLQTLNLNSHRSLNSRCSTLRTCIVYLALLSITVIVVLLAVPSKYGEALVDRLSVEMGTTSQAGEDLDRADIERRPVIHIPSRSAFEKDENELVIGDRAGIVEPLLPTFSQDEIWSEPLEFEYYPWDEVTKSPTPRPTRAPTVMKTAKPTRSPDQVIPAKEKNIVERVETFPENMYWRTAADLDAAIENCDERIAKHKRAPRSENLEILKADCGLGYTLPRNVTDLPFPRTSPSATIKSGKTGSSQVANETSKWRVFFIGADWGDPKTRFLSGCPRRCPLSPNCALFYDSDEFQYGLEIADVVVAFSYSFLSLRRKIRVPDSVKHRVVYWREASWSSPPLEFQKTEKFSFEMGVHFSAGILNPSFLVRPSQLHRGVFMDEPKEYFAASVISDCGATSRRDDYLRMVMEALSANGYRVHRYGKCGNRELPGTNLQQALRFLAKYKFFFSFENTVQAGYVTEKLFTALTLPLIPVFYGTPLVPNITRTPSFIKASDFATPKHLADYMIHLDTHPEEYVRYGQWRKIEPAKAFTAEYVHTLQNRVAGPKEVKLNYGSERTAQCCRLCDPEYVKWVSARPKREGLVNVPMSVEDIDLKFFSGVLGKS